MKIISSDKENLLTTSILRFSNSSSDLISSKNIYIISDEELTKLSCKILSSEVFSLFEVVDDKFQTVEELTLLNSEISTQQSKFVYRLKMYFSSPFAGKFSSTLRLIVNDQVFNYTLLGEAIELDEKLLTTLQNFRQTFDDDYLTAFFESDVKATSIDYELYNRKVREFLMNIHSLIGMHGSYKNLFDALQFFGYSTLLDLREYWTNNNIYKSTSIANYVLNYIDKSLVGFSKTNNMSLVYQINEESGFDDDGLPLYTTIFSITEDILLKLEALKRVLEKDFLHFNTFIVDIVGEMQTVIGLELNVMWNDAVIHSINLTDNLYVGVELSLDKDLLKIKKRQVKLKNMLYQIVDDETIADFANFIDYNLMNFFEVDDIYESSDDVMPDEFIENYYQDVFAIIKLNVELNVLRYQSFQYRVYDENDLVFTSEYKDIDKFKNHILCAIRKPGNYKINISFVDWYGGHTIVGLNDYFQVFTNEVVMHLLSYNKITSESKFTSTSSMLTFDTIKNKVPVQFVNSIFDINTFNQQTNNQNLQIQKHITNDIDNYSAYSTLNEFNGVPLKSLSKIKINNFGSTHLVGLIDIIGDETVTGNRTIQIHDVTSHQTISHSKLWLTTRNKIKWLMELIQELIALEYDVFKDFSYDIQMFGSENDRIITELPMLRIRSIASSYRSRFLNIEINSDMAPLSRFNEKIVLKDIFITNKLYSLSAFSLIDVNTSGKLSIRMFDGEHETLSIFADDKNLYISEDNYIMQTLEDVKNAIEALAEIHNLQINIFIDEVRDLIYVSADKHFVIEHFSFGKIYDFVRGKQFEKAYVLQYGDELKYGESFIAEFDDINLSDMHDITWSLYDETSNQLLVQQTSSRLLYVAKIRTTYSILVEYYIDNEKFETYHAGCFLVK